jgi:hypothetical protein
MAHATSVITMGLPTKKQKSAVTGCTSWCQIDEVAAARPRLPKKIDETTLTPSEWYNFFHE